MSVFHLNFFFLGTEDLFFVFALDLCFDTNLSSIFVCTRKGMLPNIAKYACVAAILARFGGTKAIT